RRPSDCRDADPARGPRRGHQRSTAAGGAGPMSDITLSVDLLERLRAIVGPQHAFTDRAQQLPYLRGWRGKDGGRTPGALGPGTTLEVSQILELAHAQGIPVVPQAGNTGLVGGQIPMRGEILLSVSRLKRVRHIDAAGYTMTVEAGLTLAEAQAAALAANRLF